MITLYRYDEMRECEDILHILPNKEQCSRRTTHSGRLMHHRTLPPSYSTSTPNTVRCRQHVPCRLPTAPVRGYVTGTPFQPLRTCNILNIIINATGMFPHTLRMIIQTTDQLQARPSTTTVHLHRAYYLQDLQHLLQPTQL